MVRRIRRVGSIFAVALLLSGPLAWAQNAEPTDAAAKADASTPKSPLLIARCADGSSLKLRLIDRKIPLKTDYGLIEIPATDVVAIDFATRQPDGVPERVKTAIEKLGDVNFDVREAASNELLSLAEAAYPALVAIVEEGGEAESIHRAELLIEQIRGSFSEEELEGRETDIVYTQKSQIAGMIERTSLKIESGLFGEQELALVKLRRINDGSVEESQLNPLPDPGTMSNYQNQAGRTFYFRLSMTPVAVRNAAQPNARNSGNVWGSDIYTLDSNLARAAIHAGVLKPGETKVVGVTILGPQQSFEGSSRNGITSSNYAAFPGAFRFKTKGARGARAGGG